MKSTWTIGGVLVGLMATASLEYQTYGVLSVPERTAPITVPVSLDGLDLTDESDARAALERLEGAAVRACFGGSRPLRPDRPTRVCRELAVEGAVASIGAPTLAAVHRRESRAER
jgi:UrcA family protein